MFVSPLAILLGLVALFAEEVPLQAKATIAGKSFSFTGKGECQHTAEASIYDVPAAMWHASFEGSTPGIERANLTVWQPKSGPAQITLYLTAGGTDYEVTTVKGGTMQGAGTGRVERQGASGTLLVEARPAGGPPIVLSVACSRFTAPEDNG